MAYKVALYTSAAPTFFPGVDGVMGVADYQCRQILEDRYHRLALVFPPHQVIGLDAVDRIPDLVKFAEAADISGAAKWLNATW